MRPDVNTCPDCGALITPQLAKCRQCGRYLHGTKLEGVIFENLLPESLRAAPGTGLMMLLCVVYYLLMVMFAGFQNALGFTSYTLDSLGAISVPEIFQGQWWRIVTSMFGHANLLHIAFNLYALASAGRLVEEAFDKKKMILIYLVSGVASMAISFGWSLLVMGNIWGGSIGASGAVCGMIGAALAAAKRMGPGGEHIKKAMIRWAVYLLIFGLAVPGIDNSAHIGGFVVGGGLAYVTPLGLTKTVGTNRMLSVLVLAMLGGVLFCIGLMLMNAKGHPASLESDRDPSTLLFFTIKPGAADEYSSQRLLLDRCSELLEKDPLSDDTVQRCELALRANQFNAGLYDALARVHDDRGDRERAHQLRRALALMARFADRSPG